MMFRTKMDQKIEGSLFTITDQSSTLITADKAPTICPSLEKLVKKILRYLNYSV